MRFLRIAVTVGVLLLAWQTVVWVTQAEPYILPGPIAVLVAWLSRYDLILSHTQTTAIEIVLGLAVGTLFGVISAIVIAQVRRVRRWLLPVLVISQAVPVFAIAPLLVLWLGYGIISKIAMASLIIYFPVTVAFLDGLRRTEAGWLDLASTMTAGATNRRWAVLLYIRIPAALPALGSGIRVAAAVAPIGAVVGEWVGSSSGLGYLMLHANARVQVDLMFAALATLAVLALALYYAIDWGLRRSMPWQREYLPDDSSGRDRREM